MHVDGGTLTEMMLYNEAIKPMMAHVKQAKAMVGNDKILKALIDRKRTLYIIRNDPVNPEWKNVKPRLVNIAGRAIGTLVKSHGEGDLYRIYVLTLRDNVDYNLASVPGDFNVPSQGMFDQEYMKKLYNLAYDMAKNGYPWEKYPPGYQPEIESNKSLSKNSP